MIEDSILPDEQDLMDAHSLSIERFGGELGVRDFSALQAALARPLQVLAYAKEMRITLYRVAATLGYSITKIRHPFADGNKRSGFDAIQIVLGLNKNYLDVSEREAERVMKGVSDGTISEEELAQWIADNSYEYDEDGDPFVEDFND